MQGCAQYTGGRTPDDRGDAARSRAATDRAAGRGRPAGDALHDHAADQQDMPLAAVGQGKASRGETVLLRGDRGRRRLLRGPLQVDVFAPDERRR